MKLRGKVALVTGAAHRVGKVIAMTLAREGADIVVHYGRSAEAAQQTAQEIAALGRRVLLHQADMGSWQQAAELGERALEALAEVVRCACIHVPTGTAKSAPIIAPSMAFGSCTYHGVFRPESAMLSNANAPLNAPVATTFVPQRGWIASSRWPACKR